MRRRPIIVIFILLTLMLSGTFSTALAENGDILWNGYDLQVLNTYDVQLVGQNSTIEVYEDKLIFDGEYIIKNKSDKTLEAILGLPANNLENIQITDKDKSVKFYNRNGSYIEDKYPSDSFPKVERWNTISLWIKNGETRIINLRYEAKLINDSKGVFSIRYNKNKDFINSDATMIVMTLNDFFPYNVLDTIGVATEKTLYSSNNKLTLEMNKNSEMLGLDYELIDKLSIDRLNFSVDKKLKNIAASFKNKDYNVVNTLSDEYIEKPGDPSFSTTQVNYIKAEAYRKQADFEKYIDIIKSINFDGLYPNRLKYKILYDLDHILAGDTQDPQLLDIMKQLQTKASGDNEYISKWMEDNGNNYIDVIQIVEPISPGDSNAKEESFIVKTISFLKLENFINKISEFKYLKLIIIIIMFILGYLLGRRTKKRKNKISYYTFKR